MIQETVEKIKIIKIMKAMRDRQKSYVNQRRKPLEFRLGDKVLLKVSLVKEIRRFNIKWKLSLWFMGPYDINENVSIVAYGSVLLPKLQHAHDVFHILQLWKYVYGVTHTKAHELLHVNINGLTYEEQPMKIVYHEVRQLRNKPVPLAIFSQAHEYCSLVKISFP